MSNINLIDINILSHENTSETLILFAIEKIYFLCDFTKSNYLNS